MGFSTRTEAYTAALLELQKLGAQTSLPQDEIKKIIQQIRQAFTNHGMNASIVSQLLFAFAEKLPEDYAVNLMSLAIKVEKSGLNELSQQVKFENPLRRRFESDVFVNLLLKPTTNMMQAVGLVSIQISDTLVNIQTKHPKLYKRLILDKNGFLNYLKASKSVIACGAFDYQPSAAEVHEILLENSPKNLATIMQIHFKFAAEVYKKIPLNLVPEREPVGKFSEIVNQHYGSWEEFCYQIKLTKKAGKKARRLISDTCGSKSELYTQAEGMRGRFGELLKIWDNQLGLFLQSQSAFAADLPRLNTKWIADAKGQIPDFESVYVGQLNGAEALYVSGPSGMTALLLGQCEVLANMTTVIQKQHYLEAIAAYVVGAGFHSLHEVIGPAAYILGLVPGYNVKIPEAGKVTAPHYDVFFQLLQRIDAEFTDVLEKAWINYLNFYEHVYLAQKKTPLVGQFFEEGKKKRKMEMPAERPVFISDFINQITHVMKKFQLEDSLFLMIDEFNNAESLHELKESVATYLENLSDIANDEENEADDGYLQIIGLLSEFKTEIDNAMPKRGYSQAK